MIARMIDRSSESEIMVLLSEFPVVGVLGPRQVGKTTLSEKIEASLSPDLYILI